MAIDIEAEVVADDEWPRPTHEQYPIDALTTAGHSLWEYRGDAWVLKRCSCAEGNQPGPPPQEKGKYEGEIKRKACVPTP